MIEKRVSGEDAFFSLLDCAKLYCAYREANEEERNTFTEEQADQVIAYAVYLERLNDQTIKQTGEEL